jgi:mannose/fructose/N-acetylgalactosamine-specific phosphotransferase system component IIB
LTSQRFVYKIHSSRLRRAKWNLQLTIKQARENKELIALSESQLMRFIDEINGITNPESHISDIKNNIKKLKFEKNLSVSRPKIKKLYEELDKYQFKKDYICVVIDSEKDYLKIYKNGFKLNGITYRRLLGTTGGVKTNTIVFVNEEILPELKRRINNGRNLTKSFTPAKLEAYNALVCSSSTPVSMPNGVVVVHDCITHFCSDVIELDDTGLDQPSMKYIKNKEIELNDSDGYGLAMPQLMERWGEEIGENFLLPGCVIRNSFCKGAVFPINFQKFANEHGLSTVTDVWGNTYDINNIELVLTESMLKLWDSYSSIEEYLKNCEENNYTFAITKSSEEELENVRTMNYQFLQSYDFTDEQIDELIAPTINEIRDILKDDYRKTIIYTKGIGLNENNVQYLDDSFATALMIEPEMRKDPYIRSQISTMIHKRIDDAKVGVLKVPANYSFVSGDPYSLCQSMFGLEVTGLLKAGQVYSKYWIDNDIKKIVSFRAPMTSHNNIRLLDVVHNEIMDEFYKYMTTPTIFNSWDTCADAMNGFDKDGDCVINTSFPLLVNNTKELPAIVCVQRKAPKCIPTEDDIMQSNINSFGNVVGEVTNKITSMFEVQARYPKDSREYRILDYRIKCGQLYQQNSIDKTKGIEAKPMPDKWYNWISNKISKGKNSAEKKENWFNRKLVADKKPYFMQYIYPAEKTRINDYIKKNNEKCLMRFRINLDELLKKENRTNEEEKFVYCYYHRMPLGTAPCTINKICWKIEEYFDDIIFSEYNDFDYTILKCDVEYSKQLFDKIKKIYNEYRKETANYMQYAKSERIKSDERQIQKYMFKETFKRKCLEQCPNEEYLCNIVLDLCYSKSKYSKQFAWDICGNMFVQNLLKRNNYMVTYPVLDENGDIEFNGMRFSMKTTKIKRDIDIEVEDNSECQLY